VDFDVVPGVASGNRGFRPTPAWRSAPCTTEADRSGPLWTGPGWRSAPGTLVLHATGFPPRRGGVLVGGERFWAPQTPVAVTAGGTAFGQRTVDTSLASLAADAGDLGGQLVVTVGRRGRRPVQAGPGGSRGRCTAGGLLVPRTKEQARAR